MNHYLQLLASLSPSEKDKLSTCLLTPTEGKIFMLLMSADKSQTEAALRIRAGITNSHFQKVCSVLLQKTYKILEPRGGIYILRYIARKSIPNVYYAEVLRQEKALLPSLSHEERETFYFIAFHYCTACPIDPKCLTKMQLYGEKYLAAIVKKNKFDALAVNLRCEAYKFFYKDIHFEISTKNVEDYFQFLLSCKENLGASNHGLAWFYLSLAIMGYHQRISHSLNDFLKAVDQVQKWRPKLIKQVSPEVEMFDLVLKTNALTEGHRYEDAYQLLIGILEQTMYPYPPLHSMTFIIAAINTARYSEAENIINQLISWLIHYAYEQTFCYMSLIQCFLLQNRYSEIPPLFAKLNCLNGGGHSETDDIVIRNYETLFSLLNDDMVTAECILKKNIQWLRRRKNIDRLSGELNLLLTLRKGISSYWQKKPIKLTYDENLSYIEINNPSFYKVILEQIETKLNYFHLPSRLVCS